MKNLRVTIKIYISQYNHLNSVLYLKWCTISISKWWNTAACFSWMCLCTKFMEPTSIIDLLKKCCITTFNSTECHLWLYWCFKPELPFSISFASNIEIHRVNSRINNVLSFQSLKYGISNKIHWRNSIQKHSQ